MTSRYVYLPKTNEVGVNKTPVCFDWFPGFSVTQKQKSIESLHSQAKLLGATNILEVSSKSKEELGVKLSAFSLKLRTVSGRDIFMESAFQGSKVFERGGPFIDLYLKKPIEAKKDERLISHGNLVGFEFKGTKFPIKPRTLFYDWLYINILAQDKELLDKVVLYDAFTDIEFNPQKSINCQAYSVALAVSLYKNNKLSEALKSLDSFVAVLKNEYEAQDPYNCVQGKLF